MKIRIGISAGGDDLGPDAMVALGQAVAGYGFDSVWLPEVLSRPGPDPLVGLAWLSGACPGLKIGTTMLLPGRNLVWLAKAIGTLDQLSSGRFLLTFVPGLAIGGERTAVGIPPSERGALMEEALPVLRRFWAGESVSHDGPSGSFTDVSVSPRPVQDPFDVWLGGNAPAALDRCGRLGDGWIPSLCTPEEAGEGKRVIDEVAASHGPCHKPGAFRDQCRLRPRRHRLQQRGGLRTGPASQGSAPGPAPPGRTGSSAGTPRILPRCRLLQVHRPPHGGPRCMGSRARGPRRRCGGSADVTETTADRRRAVVEFLRAHGADGTPHIFGDLLSHLVGVETLVARLGRLRPPGAGRARPCHVRDRWLRAVHSGARATSGARRRHRTRGRGLRVLLRRLRSRRLLPAARLSGHGARRPLLPRPLHRVPFDAERRVRRRASSI